MLRPFPCLFSILIQNLAAFHVHITELFICSADADIEIDIVVFRNLFQFFNKSRNIFKSDISMF